MSEKNDIARDMENDALGIESLHDDDRKRERPTDAELQSWLGLSEKATPGTLESTGYGFHELNGDGLVWQNEQRAVFENSDDAKFYLASRDAMPRLLVEVVRLRAQIEHAGLARYWHGQP